MPNKSTSPLRTVRDFIRYASTRLSNSDLSYGHGYDNPYDEAAFLVLRLLSIPLDYEDKFLDAAITYNERKKLLKAIDARCDDLMPTAYITKEWWLAGYRFYVDKRVLIPRSFIAELLKDSLSPWVEDPEAVTSVLDMCTGLGCLAIMAADIFPNAQIDAADISSKALAVAKNNIANYGLEDVVHPIKSDVYSALSGKQYDVIISNPPYVTDEAIKTLPREYRHEPVLGLAAGPDGMDVIKKIMAGAREHLTDNGILVVELGNGREAFEKIWPDIPVVWLTTSGGDDQVFTVKKQDLPDA